jgi:hypothetical protein
MVRLLTRESSPTLINNYTSKISVELSKSSKSYEREAALLYFYHGKSIIIKQLFTVQSNSSSSIDLVKNI